MQLQFRSLQIDNVRTCSMDDQLKIHNGPTLDSPTVQMSCHRDDQQACTQLIWFKEIILIFKFQKTIFFKKYSDNWISRVGRTCRSPVHTHTSRQSTADVHCRLWNWRFGRFFVKVISQFFKTIFKSRLRPDADGHDGHNTIAELSARLRQRHALRVECPGARRILHSLRFRSATFRCTSESILWRRLCLGECFAIFWKIKYF